MEVHLPGSPSLLFISVYRRPQGDSLDSLALKISCLNPHYKNIIMVGDFNRNVLAKNAGSLDISKIACDESFYRVPFGVTHHHSFRNSLGTIQRASTEIDLIFTDSNVKVISYKKELVPHISDHYMLLLDYKLHSSKPKEQLITYRNFKNCDYQNFSNSLKDDLFNLINTNSYYLQNINDLIVKFYYILNRNLDKFAPSCTRLFRKPPAPWITPELRLKFKARDKLYKTAKTENDPSILSLYKDHRRELKKESLRLRNIYYSSVLHDTTDRAKLWSTLKTIGLLKPSENSALQHFSAQQLNSHYANIGNRHPPCTLLNLPLF